MPDTTKIIHYCAKCGKPMSYAEKTMMYLYKMFTDQMWKCCTKVRPFKDEAYNLCPSCMAELKALLRRFLGGENDVP